MNYVMCSACGKRVSNYVSESILVRAYVECPECIGVDKQIEVVNMAKPDTSPQLSEVQAIVEKHLCPDGYIKNGEFEMERVLVEWLYKDDIDALIKELSEHFL